MVGPALGALDGLASSATIRAEGTSWRSSPILLGTTAALSDETPVTLPPGWLKLATRPPAIGSAPVSKTIGMEEVAAFAARAAARLPGAAITATFRATSSAASDGRRALWLSAHLYSMRRLRPSSKPPLARPALKELTRV